MFRIDMNGETMLLNDKKLILEVEAGDKVYTSSAKDPVEFLISRYGLKQVVKVKFNEKMEPITATIRGIHFYEGKVKYDLALWLGDGSVDDPEWESRIYNVDSYHVHDCVVGSIVTSDPLN